MTKKLDMSNYSINYIYKCIKTLYDNNDNKNEEVYNKLLTHIKKHPESLYEKSSVYTPYIYAASISLNTLMTFHNIYLILYKKIDLPDVFVEPYQLKNKNGDTLIHYMTHKIIKEKKDIKQMYSILEYIIDTINVNINDTDKDGNTALHLASKGNKIDLVKMLLFNGINPNIINYDKKIALNYAVINNNVDIFKVLLYKNSNYKYIIVEDYPNYQLFNEIIERYKKKLYRKVVNKSKKIKSIKRNKQLQARHVFLCNEICRKLEAVNNDTQFLKYKSELFNIAQSLNINIVNVKDELNLHQLHIETELNIFKKLCKTISYKILLQKSLKR
jgi:hypothetical protein